MTDDDAGVVAAAPDVAVLAPSQRAPEVDTGLPRQRGTTAEPQQVDLGVALLGTPAPGVSRGLLVSLLALALVVGGVGGVLWALVS